MIFTIATHEKRKIVTIDIRGAYLNTTMPTKVYMRIDSVVATVLCEFDESYKNYRDADSTLVVLLKKCGKCNFMV